MLTGKCYVRTHLQRSILSYVDTSLESLVLQTMCRGLRKVNASTALSNAVDDADTRLTPLLLSTGRPLIAVTSSPLFDVSFCVFRLKPVN